MPLFRGVGPRIAARMIALGYVRANGTPNVPRWCLEKRYDKTVVYYWINDQRTPMKDRLRRLAKDLGVAPEWLLVGAEPASKKRGRPRKAVTALLLGALALAGVPAHGGTLSVDDPARENRHYVNYRRRRRTTIFGSPDAIPTAA